MPYGKLDNLQDCEDFVDGCLFMGTGGGGDVEWGLGMLKEALEDGVSLEWVDVADIPADVMTVTPYGMGSIAPTTEKTKAEITRHGLMNKFGDRSMALDWGSGLSMAIMLVERYRMKCRVLLTCTASTAGLLQVWINGVT